MRNKTPEFKGPNVTRRQVLGTASVAAGAATALSAAPWTVAEAEIEKLKSEGWEAKPAICHMCGGCCGLLALHKKGTPVSRDTVRVVPNPSHPQRGYCARGASAMWIWDHPLRLKKPMKRIGERGEGKFKEVSWEEALDGIAGKLKSIVDKDGEKAIALTTHSYGGIQSWFASALGTPNLIKHSSTCNTASVVARTIVFGKGFHGAGKIEPDYSNVRFLLMMGRSLNCAIGVASVVARARAEKGCEVTFVDPRMPEGAFAGGNWMPIIPGTDAALILAMLNIANRDHLADETYLAKHTNAAYLMTMDSKPVTQAMLVEGGNKNKFAVVDAKTQQVRFQGVNADKSGFDEEADTMPDLRFEGVLKNAAGEELAVTTGFNLLMANAAKYTPQKAAEITGIPANQIVELATKFFTLGGVCDDGWYSARNGNDTETFALMCILNLFTGHFDQKGGLVVTQGGGFKGVGCSLKGAAGKGPNGQKWTITGETKRLDKVYYPETTGTFSAIYEAIHTGKPYPVRGLFVTGSTLFHREANTANLEKALKALDLMVVQDVLPHEVIDYADYVLPSFYFMERDDYDKVKWNVDGNVHANKVAFNPPEGNDSRDEIWQFCEILRRAYPERAAQRLGYDHEIRTAQGFRDWYKKLVDKNWGKFIVSLNEKTPGLGDRVFRDVHEHGWAKVKNKKFGVYSYQKPVGTPTGKPEIVSFMLAQKYLGKDCIQPVYDYHRSPTYQQPKKNSNEFILVSGKDAGSTSGLALFTKTTEFLGDRSLWINPTDAERLGLTDGDMVELEALNTHVKATCKLKLTNRVGRGSLFHYGFSGGSQTKQPTPGYDFVREGFNSHRLCTGTPEPLTGALANNTSVRIKRI